LPGESCTPPARLQGVGKPLKGVPESSRKLKYTTQLFDGVEGLSGSQPGQPSPENRLCGDSRQFGRKSPTCLFAFINSSRILPDYARFGPESLPPSRRCCPAIYNHVYASGGEKFPPAVS